MDHEPQARTEGYWRSKSGIALCVFLGIAGVYLIIEHRAHALEWLPYLLLLACPLMHVFMHRGHGGHGGHAAGRVPAREAAPLPHEQSGSDPREDIKP